MSVEMLEIAHFPPDGIATSGRGWDMDWHPNPDWESIEASIRRLDRDEYPVVWLHTSEPADGDRPRKALCVMGGRGEYAMLFSWNGGEVRYHDESRRDTEVRIWESDQGSVQREKDLCNDLAKVLAAAKHFFVSGDLLPELTWVE